MACFSLADLYKPNAMRETTQPLVGEQILLKGKANYPPKVKYERQQPNTNLVTAPTTAPAPSKIQTLFLDELPSIATTH